MTVTLDLNASSTDSHTRRVLSEISLAVAKRKKIVVVTGAGISCSCGIPDFRSSDGLYALVKERFPDVVLKGRDLFDAALFRDAASTAVFYSFISGLKRSIDSAKPAPTHHFIKTLDAKNKLLRSYTQNIDGLESRVGLLGTSSEDAKSNGKGKFKIRTKDVRNVQLHGDIHRVRCMACSAEYPCSEEHLVSFERGVPPDCPECLSRSEARVARSARAIRVGSLRPAIVLYDETHPLGEEIGTIHTSDLTRKPDMLIIMGTSLKVHGLRKLVKEFARTIHSSNNASTSSKRPYQVIFVNKTPPSSEWADIIDCHVAGETDQWTDKVIEDWKKMRPVDWEIQQTLIDGAGDLSIGGLKVAKSVAGALAKPRKAGKEIENVAPRPSGSTTSGVKAVDAIGLPLSPSKRRQKTSHYDHLESSPSKRKSTTVHHMLQEERKMLFTESTNRQPCVVSETSKMDISVFDLSMQDIGQGSLELKNNGSGHLQASEISKMDISVAIKDVGELPPIQARRKPTVRKPPAKSQLPTMKRATRPRKAAQTAVSKVR